MKKIIIAAILMAVSGGAAAEDGGYIGLGVGASSTTIQDPSTGFDTTYSGTPVRFFGGVRNGNFAVEGEYIDFGTFIDTSIVSFSAYGFGVSAVGFLPLNPGFSFYGKVGLTDITTTATPGPCCILLVPASQSKLGLSFGFGGQFELNRNFALRLSLDSYAYSALQSNLTGRVGVFGVSGIVKF